MIIFPMQRIHLTKYECHFKGFNLFLKLEREKERFQIIKYNSKLSLFKIFPPTQQQK